MRLLDSAVTVSVAPDARRPFLVQTAEGTVRALGTRYMVRQQAQRTVVVVHEHEVEVETMSGAHGTVRAGTGARFDASRMDTPRAELMAEAAWEAGWVEARGRPLAEVIAALRPYRSGTLRVSMAAGGLPVSGHFPLDDTDAALDTLKDMMPIHVAPLHALVRVDQRRHLTTSAPAPCRGARFVVYSSRCFYPVGATGFPQGRSFLQAFRGSSARVLSPGHFSQRPRPVDGRLHQ